MINIGEDISNAEAGGYLVLGFVVLGLVVWIVYEIVEAGNAVTTALCNIPIISCGIPECPSCFGGGTTETDPGLDPSNMTAADMSGFTA